MSRLTIWVNPASRRKRMVTLMQEAWFAAGFGNDRFNMAERMADYLLANGVTLASPQRESEGE